MAFSAFDSLSSLFKKVAGAYAEKKAHTALMDELHTHIRSGNAAALSERIESAAAGGRPLSADDKGALLLQALYQKGRACFDTLFAEAGNDPNMIVTEWQPDATGGVLFLKKPLLLAAIDAGNQDVALELATHPETDISAVGEEIYSSFRIHVETSLGDLAGRADGQGLTKVAEILRTRAQTEGVAPRPKRNVSGAFPLIP